MCKEAKCGNVKVRRKIQLSSHGGFFRQFRTEKPYASNSALSRFGSFTNLETGRAVIWSGG
jgi:hypothetical protein